MKTRSTTTGIIPNAEQHRLLAYNSQSGDQAAPVLATLQKGPTGILTVSSESILRATISSPTRTGTFTPEGHFPTQTFDIIYADPPWSYDNPKGNNPAMGGITYQTMTLTDICNLPVSKIAKKDSALFLWATMPKLNEAFTVIEAWGFTYTTCAFVWVKQNPKTDGIYSGLGHWTNGNAELCLFAKKGKPKRKAKNVKQIVLAHRGRHSEKPAEVRQRIVDLMGDLPKVELFARQKATGWDAWGNEI